MKQSANNPSTNQLGNGLSEEAIATAVEKSGYPLQTIIANALRQSFHVQEEWSYLDKDTKELRAIDILAGKQLFDITDQQSRVRPILNLLIECKQSSLPYIFFLSPTKSWKLNFPVLAGIFHQNIRITTDDDPSSWIFPVLNALELHNHQFITETEYSTTFSKCVRKGSNLELSGSESFHGLVLPLIKSLYHFEVAEKPRDTFVYFDAHLSISIGVLDAPMIGVRSQEKSNNLVLLPWVRVLRHEYFEDPYSIDKSKVFAIDIVHKDFFQQYLDNHVLPFAKEFAKRVIKHQEVVATGKGFVSGMARVGGEDIESRLEPKKD